MKGTKGHMLKPRSGRGAVASTSQHLPAAASTTPLFLARRCSPTPTPLIALHATPPHPTPSLQVVEHVESWNVSGTQALLQLFKPSGRRGGQKEEVS